MKLKVFNIHKDDKLIELALLKPDAKSITAANRFYNKAFREALDGGALLRAKLERYLDEQGIWDKDRQNKFNNLRDEILTNEYKLAQKGIKLSEAKEIALKIKDLRNEMRELIAERTFIESNTAEAQADNARFNYLVVLCTVYNDTGKPYFKDYDDFLEKSNEFITIQICQKFADVYYNLDEKYESKLPENIFLKKYKFVDDELRLIDKDGRLIDRSGRHIDEFGRYIKYNQDGTYIYVDINGREITKDGELKVRESSYFLDEDGQPIEEHLPMDSQAN